MKKHTNYGQEQGFSVLYLILALLSVGIIGFTGGVVYRANQQVNKSANAVENEPDAPINADTKKIVVEEAPKPVEEPKPEEKPKEPTPAPTKKKTEPAPDKKKKETPSYNMVTIASTTADVQADTVVLTANLPASYSGTCKALVKQDGGANSQWFEAPFSNGNSCSVSISRDKFPAAGTWYFYMYFKSSDGMTKGQSSQNSFTL